MNKDVRTVQLSKRSRLTGETMQIERKEVRCCGEWLRCDNFTTTCPDCGADYNMSGDRLAPREQWGEETGERWRDRY
jgi:hypothetical protein